MEPEIEYLELKEEDVERFYLSVLWNLLETDKLLEEIFGKLEICSKKVTRDIQQIQEKYDDMLAKYLAPDEQNDEKNRL